MNNYLYYFDSIGVIINLFSYLIIKIKIIIITTTTIINNNLTINTILVFGLT